MSKAMYWAPLLCALVACAHCSGDDSVPASPVDASSTQDGALPGDSSVVVDAQADVPVGPVEPIHFLGRFDTTDPAGPRFAWPGSAIAARFTGTGIDIALTDQGNNYWDVILDNGAATTLQTSGAMPTYTLATGLPNGTHDLFIVKRTESFAGVGFPWMSSLW